LKPLNTFGALITNGGREDEGNEPKRVIIFKRNKIMLSLLVYQGSKTGELAALETKDVKLKKVMSKYPETEMEMHVC
jgi:integrase